jgi:hypothetical protein
VVGQAAAVVSPQQPVSGNNTSANVPAPTPTDPATVTFTTDIGLVLHAVKAANVADYENMLTALQEALAASTDPDVHKMAAGWRVFKSADADAKANALYIHMLQPAVSGVDYRPSLWLDKLLSGAPPELLAKYRDSFAAPPTRLSLTEFAQMSVAPVSKPPGNASPASPANASPGNASPRSASPNNATPGNATSGNATPGNATAPKPPPPRNQDAFFLLSETQVRSHVEALVGLVKRAAVQAEHPVIEPQP